VPGQTDRHTGLSALTLNQ